MRALLECHGIVVAMRGPANGLTFAEFRKRLHEDVASFLPPGIEPQGLEDVATFEDGSISGGLFDLEAEQRAVLRTARRLGHAVGSMDDATLRDEIDQESVYEALKRSGDEKVYAAGRRALVEHPVRTVEEVTDLPLPSVIRAAYQPISADARIAGWWYPCPVCAWPMRITMERGAGRARRGAGVGHARCWHRAHVRMGASYEFRVPADGSPPRLEPATKPPGLARREKVLAPVVEDPPRALLAEDGLALNRGVWRYTTVPGLVEIALHDALDARGLDVTIWPGLDIYDVRVALPGGKRVWKVDVKDYTSGAALGNLIRAQRGDPGGADWLVVPDHRGDQTPLLSGVCEEFGMSVATASGFGEMVCKEAGVRWA